MCMILLATQTRSEINDMLETIENNTNDTIYVVLSNSETIYSSQDTNLNKNNMKKEDGINMTIIIIEVVIGVICLGLASYFVYWLYVAKCKYVHTMYTIYIDIY